MITQNRQNSPHALHEALNDVLQPGRFFVPHGYELKIGYLADETVPWEIFHGHLLEPGQCREEKTFESWIWFFGRQGNLPDEPLVAIKHDQPENRVHIVRQILTYGHEVYEQPQGAAAALQSRPAKKWKPELAATIDLSRPREAPELAAELRACLYAAVAGRRLPITSLESPLPAFSLGQFFYWPGSNPPAAAFREPRDLVENAWSASNPPWLSARVLETMLRSAEEGQLRALTTLLVDRWKETGGNDADLCEVFRELFGQVALSPYTGFFDRWVDLLVRLADEKFAGAAAIADVMSLMLRQLVRHLTAFDLRTFHNFGANYPDALVLDTVLAAYNNLLCKQQNLLVDASGDDARSARSKRLRRRALRQGWLLRKHYEGLPVPDAPTSAGENLRVLPERFPRVPPEQIVEPSRRQKKLFAEAPAHERLTAEARELLERSLADLDETAELRELGMALFLDRPLGVWKHPREPDRTTLLSYEAFSASIAGQRLAALRDWGWLEEEQHDRWADRLAQLAPRGFPAAQLTGQPRTSVVALEDANKAADDFVFLRTTRRSLREFLTRYDIAPLREVAPSTADWLQSSGPSLLLRTTSPSQTPPEVRLVAFDGEMQPRVEFVMAAEHAPTLEAGGRELVAEGLPVGRVRESGGEWTDLPPGFKLPPNWT